MKAMLFAAGLGTRLRPLTDTLPKCLVPVNGRPMIDYPLMLLRHYGIREIVVNVHHHADRVEEHLGDGSRFGVGIVYSREPVLLDTGGGLLGAKRFLDRDTFVIVNSDVLIDLRLDEVLRFHREREAAATLVLRKDPLADEYGAVWTDAEGTIRKLLQHEAPGATPSPLEQYMFTGVHVVEPRIFQYMEGPEPFSITRTPTRECSPAPSAFAAFPSTGTGRIWGPRSGWGLRKRSCERAASDPIISRNMAYAESRIGRRHSPHESPKRQCPRAAHRIRAMADAMQRRDRRSVKQGAALRVVVERTGPGRAD